MPILPGLCDTKENIEMVIKACTDHGGQFILAAPLTMADQQKSYFLSFLKENEIDLHDLYHRLYPARSYGPVSNTWIKTALYIRELCTKHRIPDRMPRPVFPKEKRALNKKAVESLADELYSLELDRAPNFKMWAIRKAAWSVEDLEQDIGLVYKTMGIKGLESIQNVGPTIATKLEQIIIEYRGPA
jgi:hypothetical protein